MRGSSSKGGRPKKTLAPGARTQIGIRVGAEIKRLLDDAMTQSGRTQSQEAELRLEMSFQKERLLPQALELAYGRQPAALLMFIARAMSWSGRVTSITSSGGRFEAIADWPTDPASYDQAAKMVTEVLEIFRPPGDPSTFQNGVAIDETNLAVMRRHHCEITVAAIKDPKWGDQFSEADKNPELEQFAEWTREMLGPLQISRLPASIEVA